MPPRPSTKPDAADTAPSSWHSFLTDPAKDFAKRWRIRAPVRAGSDKAPAIFTIREAVWLLVSLAVIAAIAVFFDQMSALAVRGLHPYWYATFEWITHLGKSGYLFFLTILIMILALYFARHAGILRQRVLARVLAGRAAYFLSVLVVSGIASILIKRLGRARPKYLDTGGPFQLDLLTLKASWSSFPSGHTVTVFVAAVALGYFLPRWRVVFWVTAALVGVSRVVLGSHYPSDVVAGALLGIVSAVIIRRFFAARNIVFSHAGRDIKVRGEGLIFKYLGKLRAANKRKPE